MPNKYPTLEEFLEFFESQLNYVEENRTAIEEAARKAENGPDPNMPVNLRKLFKLRENLESAYKKGLSSTFDSKNATDDDRAAEYDKNQHKIIFDEKTKDIWNDILLASIAADKLKKNKGNDYTKLDETDPKGDVYNLANMLGYHAIPGKMPSQASLYYDDYKANKFKFSRRRSPLSDSDKIKGIVDAINSIYTKLFGLDKKSADKSEAYSNLMNALKGMKDVSDKDSFEKGFSDVLKAINAYHQMHKDAAELTAAEKTRLSSVSSLLALKKIFDCGLSMDDNSAQALLLASNIAAGRLAKNPTKENIKMLCDAQSMEKAANDLYSGAAFEFFTFGKTAEELKEMAALAPEKVYDDFFYFSTLNDQIISDTTYDRGSTTRVWEGAGFEEQAELKIEERDAAIKESYDPLAVKAKAKVDELINNDKRGTQQFNKATYQNKAMLENLLNTYKEELGKDISDLQPIFSKLQDYLVLNNGKVTKTSTLMEVGLLRQIHSMIDKYTDDAVKKINSGNGRVLLESDILDSKLAALANISHFLDAGEMGGLDRSNIPENSIKMDLSSFEVIDTNSDGKIDRSNDPLFTHDPSFEDVQQGGIGDCYYMAGLSKIAADFPEKIRESMVDNGNGTVTVRLFGRGPGDPEDPYAHRPLTPVYVTVNKIVPKTGGASGALWVQMFEKAYAASGLNMGNGLSGEIMKGDFNERYEYYRTHPKEKPSFMECPWLVDPDGKLHKWEPHYSDIAGGTNEEVIETILGEDYRGLYFDLMNYNKHNAENSELIKNTRDIWTRSLKDVFLKQNPGWTDEHKYFHNYGKNMVNQLYCAMAEIISGEAQIDIVLKADDKINPEKVFKHKLPPAWNNIFDNINASYLAASSDIGGNEIITDMVKNGPKKFLNDINAFCDALKEAEANKTKIDLKDARYETLFRYIPEGEEADYLTEYKMHPEYFEGLQKIASAVKDTADIVAAKKYSGNYSSLEDGIWDKINAAAKDGCIINAGSHPKATMPGIVAGHAYTVLGTLTKKVGDKELRFVRLRNPWGEVDRKNTPVYSADEHNKVVVSHEEHPTDGTFELEFSDFMSSYAAISFNGKTDVLRKYGDGLTEGELNLDKDAMTDFAETLQELEKELKATDGGHTWDSDEYKELKSSLAELRRESTSFYLAPRSIANQKAHDVYKAAENYLTHCKNSKAIFNPEKRANRVRIAEAIKFVTDGVCSSKVYLNRMVAEKYYDSIKDLAERKLIEMSTPASEVWKHKDKAIELIQSADHFKKIMNSKSFTEGHALLGRSSAALAKEFVNLGIKGPTQEELAAWTAEEKNTGKNTKPDENEIKIS